jgi:hypothetical protein
MTTEGWTCVSNWHYESAPPKPVEAVQVNALTRLNDHYNAPTPSPIDTTGQEKAFVRDIFPEAYCWDTKRGGFDIIDCLDKTMAMSVGYGRTEDTAWKDAAARQGFGQSSPAFIDTTAPQMIPPELQPATTQGDYERHIFTGGKFANLCHHCGRERNDFQYHFEPKPAPQAETRTNEEEMRIARSEWRDEVTGYPNPFNAFESGFYAAQSPLLQKISELEKDRNRHAVNAVELMRQRDEGRTLIDELEQKLAEMTKDRDLWADEHSGDCPNVARVAELESALAQKTGVRLIQAERQRQMDVEEWTPEHDAEHKFGEMSDAAACYAKVAAMIVYPGPIPLEVPASWPWENSWWKPSSDPVRNLVKAGALIAAEIDRLQRAQPNADDEEMDK